MTQIQLPFGRLFPEFFKISSPQNLHTFLKYPSIIQKFQVHLFQIRGFLCQAWDQDFPNVPNFRPSDYKNGHNHCRAINDEHPWCYTNSIFNRWDYCNCNVSFSSLDTIDEWNPTKAPTSDEDFDFDETSYIDKYLNTFGEYRKS